MSSLSVPVPLSVPPLITISGVDDTTAAAAAAVPKLFLFVAGFVTTTRAAGGPTQRRSRILDTGFRVEDGTLGFLCCHGNDGPLVLRSTDRRRMEVIMAFRGLETPARHSHGWHYGKDLSLHCKN